MVKIRVLIDGQPVLPAGDGWVDLNRESADALLRVFARGPDRGSVGLRLQLPGLSLKAVKNAVAVVVKGWAHLQFISNGALLPQFTPPLPNVSNGSPHQMLETDAAGTHALKFDVPISGTSLAVIGPVLVLRLANLLRWAAAYGDNCKLTSSKTLKRSTFDAITLRVEPGLDVAAHPRQRPSAASAPVLIPTPNEESADEDEPEDEPEPEDEDDHE